jgi:hypothetical protein
VAAGVEETAWDLERVEMTTAYMAHKKEATNTVELKW